MNNEKEKTFIEICELVLSEVKQPLTANELWKYGKRHKKSCGATPVATISSLLYAQIQKPNSKFKRIEEDGEPIRYTLTELEDTDVPPLSSESPSNVEEKWNERYLHPLVTFREFQRNQMYTKTIYHERSSKGRQSYWLHPDLIGVKFNSLNFPKDYCNISKRLGIARKKVILSSFEVKTTLSTYSEMKEYVSQTNQNSTWANEAWLCVLQIENDISFRQDLAESAITSGIGVIELQEQPQLSQVLVPAAHREDIHEERLATLYDTNPDVRDLICSIDTMVYSGEINESKFDPILEPNQLKELMSKRLKVLNKS